jgi:hypothetical protein
MLLAVFVDAPAFPELQGTGGGYSVRVVERD